MSFNMMTATKILVHVVLAACSSIQVVGLGLDNAGIVATASKMSNTHAGVAAPLVYPLREKREDAVYKITPRFPVAQLYGHDRQVLRTAEVGMLMHRQVPGNATSGSQTPKPSSSFSLSANSSSPEDTRFDYSYVSMNSKTGIRGNLIVWTMAVVYGSLTVMSCVLYVIWADRAGAKTPDQIHRKHPELGLPAGYVM